MNPEASLIVVFGGLVIIATFLCWAIISLPIATAIWMFVRYWRRETRAWGSIYRDVFECSNILVPKRFKE